MNSLAVGGDEGAAVGLAVTIWSAVRNLSQCLDIYVLDTGISPRSRERLVRVHPDLIWIEVPPSRLRDLPTNLHLTRGTYARLLIAELLPAAQRVVYLDSDVVVRRDIMPLFEVELAGHPLAAVMDFETPGSADRLNFNAGVLVLDAQHWRETGFGRRVITYLERHGEQLRNLDQNALNDVAGGWVELDWRWNVQQALTWVDKRPHDDFTDILVAERDVLNREAAIVHFSSTPKPWYHGSTAPGTWLWVTTLLRSGYYGPLERAWWIMAWLGKRTIRRILALLESVVGNSS